MDLLTVIMPVYNGEKYLEEAINSVLNQTFTDFKLLVLNDNSSDRTSSILDAYQKKDSRIEVINKAKNEGPARLRNEGIDRAQTEFIAIMDADDISQPTRFEKQIRVFKEHPEVGLCCSWFTIFGNKKEKIIKHSKTHDALKVQFLENCAVGNSTVMLRKEALGDLRFETEFIVAEDYVLWSKLIRNTKFHNIQESLVRYRWHQTNISQTREQYAQDTERIIRERQLNYLGIKADDDSMENYLNAISLKRNLTLDQIKPAIKASKDLIKVNKSANYYDSIILENHLNKLMIRTLRNAKSYNKEFYNFVKNESGYYSQIPFIDKIVLFFRCLF